MRAKQVLLFTLIAGVAGLAQASAPQTAETLRQLYQPAKAPAPKRLLLRPGDRLAICGDSITEQKMYSRIIEDYLTVCVPELNVSVRQYGWGGERAPGFLARMTNDCLRFRPTLATTCYGMNDHEYRAYEDRIGQTYREASTAIVRAFKARGVRVIQGAPGIVGKVPGWTRHTNDTRLDLNRNLGRLRNLGIEIAKAERVGFADVFWAMLTADATARQVYGPGYALAGEDGVHPGWAGHLVMAYAFLKGMGLTGDIGRFEVELKKNRMTLSPGHRLVSAREGEFVIQSSRYPFCACAPAGLGGASYPVCGADDPARDSSIRSALKLVPFNEELNRLTLKVRNVRSGRSYRVTWGAEARTFTGEQLRRGVNLAAEFARNPFSEAFARVDAAVAAKQAYETTQIKTRFRSPEAKADMEAVAAQTEREREPLAAAIRAAFVPVTHTLRIERAP